MFNLVEVIMRIFLFVILFFLSSFSHAQRSNVKKAQDNFEEAQYYIKQNMHSQAVKYLKLAINQDPYFVAAYLQLGNIYHQIKDYETAKQNFKLALANSPNSDARICFILAENELLTGDYENAKQNYTSFVTRYTGNDTLSIKKAAKALLDCNFALNALKNPVVYQPKNMGANINSEHSDYFPSLTADQQSIIFSRAINNNEDFYISTKSKNEWQKAVPLSNKINTPDYNEGAQSLSPDGKYLFFTGCNRPDGFGRCDIYLSIKEGNTWGKPSNLGSVINTPYWESQPSISPDGYTLYFVSNMPGGYGGNDIWKSVLNENGKWTPPVNLGPQINTAYDEVSPFIHADNKTLYFASDGWLGMGKKDLFMTKKDADGNFGKPINLGYPINTFNEELGLTVTADGNKGFFSSNLSGGFGNIDIYYFDMPDQIKPNPVTYVKGIIKDKDTGKPLKASILVVNLDSRETVYHDHTSPETGDFLTVMPVGYQYSFNAEAQGYLFCSMHYELKQNKTDMPIEIDIFLEKIKVGSEVVMKNIFFDTNKYDLLPQSIGELEILRELLTKNSSLHIEIQGHTDNTGEVKANKKLAENRAKAVRDYLIERGINAKRLTFKGYGESKPIGNNSTEEGRKQNRRTNFIITKL